MDPQERINQLLAIPKDKRTDADRAEYARLYEQVRAQPAPEQPQPKQEPQKPWALNMAEDIALPALGAGIGALVPIPGAVPAGTFAGEYIAQDMPHGLDRLKTAGANTLLDLGLGFAGGKLAKTKLGGKVADSLADIGKWVENTLTPAPKNTQAAQQLAQQRTARIVEGGQPTAYDVETIGRPLAESAPSSAMIPKNSIEDFLQMQELRSPRRATRTAAQGKQAAALEHVEKTTAKELPFATNKAEFGEFIEKNLDAKEKMLADHDFEFWGNIRHPTWSSTGTAQKDLINKTQGAIQRADNASGGLFTRKQYGGDKSSQVSQLIEGVRELRADLKTGDADQIDIDAMRRRIGYVLRNSNMEEGERRALSALKDGIENAQKSVLPDSYVKVWDKQMREWADYATARDFVKKLNKGRYENVLNSLTNDTKAFRSFWNIANDETKKVFTQSIGGNIIENSKSLQSAAEQMRKLPPDIQAAMQSAKTPAGGSVADSIVQLAALRDVVKYTERAAASATANPIRVTDIEGMAKWALTGMGGRAVYERAREIYPILFNYAQSQNPALASAAKAARVLVEQIIKTGGQATAREALAPNEAYAGGIGEPMEYRDGVPVLKIQGQKQQPQTLQELGAR